MGMRVDGIDISHHQAGKLDMSLARKRGLKWLYHKATEGDAWRDDRYHQRRREAKQAGIPFGAYHFARAERGDAQREALAFLAYAQPKPGDLKPALDLETSEGLDILAIRAWAATFIRTVEKALGVKPVVYTPYDLGAAARGCVIWRPRYNSTNTPPVLAWDIWQFSNGVLGEPDDFPGFGHVDLNTMRKGLTLDALLIPEKEKPMPNKTRTLKIGWLPGQYSDSLSQMMFDADKLFSRGMDLLGGTEAMSEESRRALNAAAKKHGYRMHIARDCFAAVTRDMVDGDWDEGYVPVLESTEGVGRHSDRGLTYIAFDNDELGRISWAAAHLLTKGRRPGDPNYRFNKRFGQAFQAYGKTAGRGSGLAFIGADFNIPDRDSDVFFDADFTTIQDELRRWENTGHGPIDGIASWDPDGRVVGKDIDTHNDREVFFHTDHFYLEARYTVKLAK